MVEKISFLKLLFGQCDVSHDSTNASFACPNPACQSRVKGKRKYVIKLTTDQSHCWVCGLKTHDSLIPIIRRYKDLTSLNEYIEKYRANPAKNIYLDPSEKYEDDVVRLPDDFQPVIQASRRDRDVKKVLDYLSSRDVSTRDMWYFKLGLSERLSERVIIPSFDAEGYVNFYVARAVNKFVRGPKYVVPSSNRVSIIFNESNVDWKSPLTIVEGPFDLMKCDDNATCLLGSGLSEDYLLFWQIVSNRTPVILALDPDVSLKMHKYAKLLSSYDVEVRTLDISGFSDVGEMSKREFLQRKSVASLWEQTSMIRNKINCMRSMSQSTMLVNQSRA
jgi:hypothetical protein